MGLVNEGKCWAADLQECEGPINKEHLATESLFGKRISVKGGAFDGREMSIKKYSAQILCYKHNCELGRTADAAALSLQRALENLSNPLKAPGSKLPRAPIARKLSGVSFGRWLCKTHCNNMVVHGFTPEPAFVHYAFQKSARTQIFIYLEAFEMEPKRYCDPENPIQRWARIEVEGRPELDIGFTVSLVGMKFAVSTKAILKDGRAMLDRPKLIELPTPLGPYRIHFDWTGEITVSQPA